ncbi:MAG: hypothetical protein ACREN2_04470 [Candidatus Dormibacteria bacterium]
MADADAQAHEADRLIARAIESVLESVPDVAGGDSPDAERSARAQPWAETAAPGGNKQSLDELLADYAARVAAAPDARAALPSEPSPGEAYLQRLSPKGGGASRRGGKRRYRGGRRRGGGRKGGAADKK